MRYRTCITQFLCLGLLISALPLSIPSSDHGNTLQQLRFDKRADRNPNPNIPRPPKTPTPEDDPSVPVPGRSGIHYQKETNLVWFRYGDNLREHAEHLTFNQQKYPENLLPFSLASATQHYDNRQNALHGIPTQSGMVRDEKPIAAFLYKCDPTVKYVSAEESRMSYCI